MSTLPPSKGQTASGQAAKREGSMVGYPVTEAERTQLHADAAEARTRMRIPSKAALIKDATLKRAAKAKQDPETGIWR